MLSWGTIITAAALAISGTDPAHAQSAIDRLQPMVESSARRLAIAEQVALAKWDTGTAVEDVPREEQVIADAIKTGKSRGLSETLIASFFKAQMEANKMVQYSLLAEWRRAGTAPAHSPIDLVHKIRPELDRLQTELLAELAETAPTRASTTCLTDVAKAVGKYIATHTQVRLPVAIALDRSLAAACPVSTH